MLSHPKVMEAVVVGIDDDIQGEKLVAVVTPRLDVTAPFTDNAAASVELKAYLETKLAHYKVPRITILMDSIPRNQLGKVNKKALRKQLQDSKAV